LGFIHSLQKLTDMMLNHRNKQFLSLLYLACTSLLMHNNLTSAFVTSIQRKNYDQFNYATKHSNKVCREMSSIHENDVIASDTKESKGDTFLKSKKKNRKNTRKRENKKPSMTTNANHKKTNKTVTKNKQSKQKAKNKQSKQKVKSLPIHNLKLGSKIDGTVAAFTSFGIFLKINYNSKGKGSKGYALLHKSQIRDEPVDDLSKLFRIGTAVKGLRVIQINYAKGEVGLSLRKKRPNRKAMNEIPLNKEIQGTVANVVAYGAFIDVGADVNALLHISRISQERIRNIREYLNEGDKVWVHIIDKDEEKKSMAASMLDSEADQYLEKRSNQMKKLKEKAQFDDNELRSEIEYFEEAIKEMEESLKES